ncbi:MAG: hypothetical protein M9916_12695 [Crocinitomicaceae bacterium]|nr:hypothetical protein [Crocinitomicaceae bacterium]
MMILSATGAFRTILIVIGAIVVLRFIGQLLNAKRNMEEDRKLNQQARKFEEDRAKAFKNFGKTRIIKDKKKIDNVQDVHYEEVE